MESPRTGPSGSVLFYSDQPGMVIRLMQPFRILSPSLPGRPQELLRLRHLPSRLFHGSDLPSGSRRPSPSAQISGKGDPSPGWAGTLLSRWAWAGTLLNV